MRRLDCLTIAWLVVILLSGPLPAADGERLSIYVVNYPLQYFAERIAGEHATDINSVVFAPCANVPAPGDFLSVMQQNVENLRIAFQ